MESWGSWSFSEENKSLLEKVLNKFAPDQCSLDPSKKHFLSSLTASSKKRAETSSSSSNDSDVDGDFEACFSKVCIVENNEETISPQTDAADNEPPCSETLIPDAFSDTSFLPSQQLARADHENVSKLIVELLNAGDCDVRGLCSLLNTELKSRPEVSEIIKDVWPEIVTDKARHRLCEALIKTDVKPQVVCVQIYLPWFQACELNLTGFIESLSTLIVHFPEYACTTFLVELLKDSNSILVKHVDWLSEIMKSVDQPYWCMLLSKYMKYCDNLEQHQIPVLLHLVKNCRKCLDGNETNRLVALCLNAVYKHSANRDFAMFLMTVIEAIDIEKFRTEMTAVCGGLKGASKFLIMKALKDAK